MHATSRGRDCLRYGSPQAKLWRISGVALSEPVVEWQMISMVLPEFELSLARPRAYSSFLPRLSTPSATAGRSFGPPTLCNVPRTVCTL